MTACLCHLLKPFVLNAPFRYPLKTSEKLTVFWCFQEVEKGCIGNNWVNLLKRRLQYRCFPNNFEKFIRNLFAEQVGRLLLYFTTPRTSGSIYLWCPHGRGWGILEIYVMFTDSIVFKLWFIFADLGEGEGHKIGIFCECHKFMTPY